MAQKRRATEIKALNVSKDAVNFSLVKIVAELLQKTLCALTNFCFHEASLDVIEYYMDLSSVMICLKDC